MSDGPFIETKELLGGFIVLEVPDEATALEISGRLAGYSARLRGGATTVGDSVAEAGMR